jgi:2-methylcitrate synthase
MDVMRTGVSVLGCLSPEKDDHNHPGARDIADKLMASLGSMLLYWYHFSHNGKRIDVETDDDSIGGHFLHLLHGEKPARQLGARHAHLADPLRRARVQRLDLHLARGRRHRFRHVLGHCGGIGALRGPKHGGANEVAFEIQKRYDNAGRGRGRHPRPRREARKSSSASATRSTP